MDTETRQWFVTWKLRGCPYIFQLEELYKIPIEAFLSCGTLYGKWTEGTAIVYLGYQNAGWRYGLVYSKYWKDLYLPPEKAATLEEAREALRLRVEENRGHLP